MPDNSLSTVLMENLATAQTIIPVNMKRQNEMSSGGKEVVISMLRAGTTGTAAIYGTDLANPWKSNNPVASVLANPAPVLQQQTQVFRGDGVTQVFDAAAIPYTAFANYNWHVDLDQFDRYPGVAAQSGVYAGWTVVSDGGTGTNLTFPTELFTGNASTTVFTGITPFQFYGGAGVTYPSSNPQTVGAYLVPTVTISGVTKVLGVDYAINNVGGFVSLTFAVAPAAASNNISVAWAPRLNMEFGLIFVPAVVTILAALAGPFKRLTNRSYDRVWAALASSPSATSIYIDAWGKGSP